MQRLIRLKDIENNPFNFTGRQVIIQAYYLPKIKGWNGGGLKEDNCNYQLPVVKSDLSINEGYILCEGVFNNMVYKIEHPWKVSFSCNINILRFIDNMQLIIKLKNNFENDRFDAGLENIISKFKQGRRPKILILHPESKTSETDLLQSIGEYSNHYIIDSREMKYIQEHKFINNFINSLRQFDEIKYDAICFVSGGRHEGYGLLHEKDVIKTLIEMKTPTLGGIGHTDEYHIFDMTFNNSFGTPSLLGITLKNIAENYS